MALVSYGLPIQILDKHATTWHHGVWALPHVSNAVYYALPLYCTWAKAISDAPNLLIDTRLLGVSSIDSSLLGRTQQRHRIEVRKASALPEASIYSPRIDSRLLNAKEAVTHPAEALPTAAWIDSGSLHEFRNEGTYGISTLALTGTSFDILAGLKLRSPK